MLMDDEDFWWIIGRYIGDGWCRSQGGIIICCEKSETEEITERLDRCNMNYSVVSERTVNKVHIPLKELEQFVKAFGYKADGKKLKIHS